jgi:hypothetical protein
LLARRSALLRAVYSSKLLDLILLEITNEYKRQYANTEFPMENMGGTAHDLTHTL